MKYGGAAATAAMLLATTLVAQPRISNIQNIYSYIRPQMPNYGIAQGSIFGIFGAGLATASSDVQVVPLPKSLGGVSVSITVNGVTTQGILYYVTPTAISAVLPSATPAGTGQLKVTVNSSSVTAPITVVPAAFGMIALNNAGDGPVAAFDLNAQYLGLTNAANPFDFITLWGTGLGPINGDETMSPPALNLASGQIEVDIGGISSAIQYAGRSTYPGLDQINVQVPVGVSGCHVSVVVRIGDIVSNFGTIPVAETGRTCSEPLSGVTASQIESLMSKSTVVKGAVDFVASGSSSADAQFVSFSNAQFAARQPFASVSFNDCVVYNFINANMAIANPIKGTALDAGPSVSLSTPSGSGIGNPILLPQNGAYEVDNLNAPGSFKGTYTFSGSGGADIRPFSVQVTFPGGGGAFNFTAGNVPSRSQGLTITWTEPGNVDPHEFVQISGFSFGPNFPVGAEFVCNVPLAARRFTIPPAVLLALPSQAGVATPYATLEVDLFLTQTFSAPGVDLGISNFILQSTMPFNYP